MNDTGRDRPSAEGVVSGFVARRGVQLLTEAIGQAAVAALAIDLLAFWPPAKPPFILALFEDKASMNEAVPRLAGIGATGATVVVGAPCKVSGLPAGLYGIDLRGYEDLLDARALVVLEGSFAAALVAVRSDIVESGASSGQPEYLYNARWTFRRHRVVDAMEQLLRPLRPALSAGLIEAAAAATVRAGEITVTHAESNLLTVLESISAGLVAAPVLTSVATPEPERPRIVRDE